MIVAQWSTGDSDTDMESENMPMADAVVDLVFLIQMIVNWKIISKYILDNQSFHKAKKTTPWSDSLVRTWLNDKFMKKAFIGEEQELIVSTTINEADSVGVKHTTSDKIFLLSEDEAKKYMSTPEARTTTGTNVADNSYWGLRSYKKGADSFQYLTASGRLMSNKFGDGFNTNYDCTLGVRPAMWIMTAVMSPEDKKCE